MFIPYYTVISEKGFDFLMIYFKSYYLSLYMSKIIQIQLGRFKNQFAIDVDQNLNVELTSSHKELLSFNESSVINVSELFNSERQESQSYRVYGRLDWMSIINGLFLQYTKIGDFFKTTRLGNELGGLSKNIVNSFDIYLCYPSTGNTQISPTEFIRNNVIISKMENIEIYKAGYSRNIFANYIYAFDFNVDFNIEGYRDSFGKPINRFYLYFNYKPTTNGNLFPETVKRKVYSGSPISLPYVTHTSGDLIVGDKVSYDMLNFEEQLIEQMEYYVSFPHADTNNFLKQMVFKYNPFIEIKVRDFSDEIVYANISGGTETDLNIPDYAIPIDNQGNYIWKNLLDNGYIDPITGAGVDYPFLNKRHYIFNTIVLPMQPDMNDTYTAGVFNDIAFGANEKLYVKPTSDLKNLGNKCA